MASNNNAEYPKCSKRSLHASNVDEHNISEESSTCSLLSTASTVSNVTTSPSRKRPRNRLTEYHAEEEFGFLHHFEQRSSTCSEDDDGSVDSVLGAVDTILREEDEVDTMESIQSRLPAPDAANDDPDDYLLMLLHAMFPQIKLQVKSSGDLNSYFPTPSEEQMANYTTEVVNVVRLNDANAMNEYYKKHGRAALDCCNRFGEGLLNMACRRGFTDTVKYLLSPDIQLNVRVRDDGGRTPLHDACWYPEPQLEVCSLILQQDPSLFLVADKRGYTPFQYARKSDWHVWRQFLYSNHQALYAFATKPEVLDTFSCNK